ncbi:TPA: hypothetical protein ACKQCJ_000775 [Stenotrophomonas maltophilia]
MANALTGNFGPLAAMGYVQEQGEMGRQRGQQNRLNMLAGQSYSATTPQQQSSLLGQIAQVSPEAAQAQQQQFQSQEDRNRSELFGLARGWKKIPSEHRQKYYDNFLSKRLNAMGFGEQPAYNEAGIDGVADQIIAAFGQNLGSDTSQNKVVGGALVTPDGRVVYEAPTNAHVIDVPDGMNGSMKMIWDPRSRQLSPLPAAAAHRGQSGPAAAPTVFRGANGEIVDMSKVTEPGLRESIMQNPGEWGLVPDGGSAEIPVRNVSSFGGLGYTPPKQREAPQGYVYQGDTLEPIPGGPADNSSPQAIATGEQSLRKEVTQNLKEDQGVLSMYRNVQAAASQPSAAGDLSLIFAFMKMLDPGSVVREQEFANAQNAAGVPDQVRNAYNKAISGQRLNPTQRQDFLNQASQLAKNAEGRITGTTRKYQEIARQYGYDPVRGTGMADFSGVTSSVSGGSEPAASTARPQTDADFKALPSGSLYIDPDDGRTYRKR